MRTSAITVLGLAAAALLSLVSFNAKAAPISVDMHACTITSGNWCDSGSSTYTNNGVTFQGWEQIVSILSGPADLTYKNGGTNEVGLGVLCTYGSGDKCGEHEINTTPGQYISASIPAHISSLSIGVQSVDGGGGDNYNETAYLYLSQCANVFYCILTGAGLPVPLDSYTFNGTNKTWTFNFTAAELSGYGYLYVTPLSGDAPDANILLSSFSYQPVPEPAALGMFGLGVLVIGAFAGLRRRLG